MSSALIEAYHRRLLSFDRVEEFYSPSQKRDREGQWTKMWSGVSAHPGHRTAPKRNDEVDPYRVFQTDLGGGYRSVVTDYYSNGLKDHVVAGQIRKGKEVVGEFSRYIDDSQGGNSRVIVHENLEIHPEHQGHGLADRFNTHAIAQYQRLGVDRIELEAGLEVGGYAWARQGYRLKDDVVDGVANDEYRRSFLNRQLDRVEGQLHKPILREHAIKIRQEVAALKKAVEAGEDIQPIHIASIGEKYARFTDRDVDGNEYETWPGKSVLLGETWHGVYYFDAAKPVTAAASDLVHAELRPAFKRELPGEVVEFTFDPRQRRDKNGKWTVGIQHVANAANAAAILKGGFSLATPDWDRSFGDGVYLAEIGDEKSAKFYARQGGRDWRTSQIIEGTVSLANPLHIEAREHSNFRAEVVKALGGTEAVRQMAQERYDHTVAVTKRITAEELGPDHGIDLTHPESVFWVSYEPTPGTPPPVSKRAEEASLRIHERVEQETGDSIQGNAEWHWLAMRTEEIAKPGVVTSSDNESHYSRLLGNLARDAGHDGIVINTNRWGGVGGQQIVVFNPAAIKVTGSHPYVRQKSVVTAAADRFGIDTESMFCVHGLLDFACHDASCRPPGSGGTGGSVAKGGTAVLGLRPPIKHQLPNQANPEVRYHERLRAIGIRDPDNIGPEYQDDKDDARAANFRALVPKDLDGAVRSRIQPSQLESILKVGMLTQHDTGFSAGMLNPALREIHEAAMFDEEGTRPVYGYIHTTETIGTRLSQYGSISVVFKNEVNDRTTVTYGDSLDESNPPAPVHLTDVHRASTMRLSEASTESGMKPGYIEAQIHGQIRPEHIAKLVIDRASASYTAGSKPGANDRWEMILGLAKQAGIPVEEATDTREFTSYGHTDDVLHFGAETMRIIARRGETEAWADEGFDPATGNVELRTPGQPTTTERWQVALKFGGWEPSTSLVAAMQRHLRSKG